MAYTEDKPRSEYEMYSDLRHLFAERAASQQIEAVIHTLKGDPIAAEESRQQAELAKSGVKVLDRDFEMRMQLINLLR